MKRFFFILLAFLTLILSGCAQENAPAVPNVTDEPIVTPEETEQAPAFTNTPVPSPAPEPTPEPTGTPVPTDTPEPTEIPDPNPDIPYYLYVEKGSFTLTIYGKDENYNYTVPIRTYRIAHGGNKTPTGIFTLTKKRYRWHDFRLGGSVQYATPYWGNLFIHSPLYQTQDPSTLWKSYYNGEDHGIGTAGTGGCLRMVTEAAKFIYDNCTEGTKLEIVNGSPRGTTSEDVPPITKKGYDPTDVEALGGGE